MLQQRSRWTQENHRALQTKDAARVIAKKSLMPEDELSRARRLRLKMTKENKMRARVQVAALSMKYRAVKNSMLTGGMDKAAYDRAYKLTSRQISAFRTEFASRQREIEKTWSLMQKRQRSAESYVDADLQKIEEIYEQTIASIADRYGRRIAYFQSLPIITNLTKLYESLNTADAGSTFRNQWDISG